MQFIINLAFVKNKFEIKKRIFHIRFNLLTSSLILRSQKLIVRNLHYRFSNS